MGLAQEEVNSADQALYQAVSGEGENVYLTPAGFEVEGAPDEATDLSCLVRMGQDTATCKGTVFSKTDLQNMAWRCRNMLLVP